MRTIKFQALDLGHPQKCWFESVNVFLDQWICYTEDEEEEGHFLYEHVSLKEYDESFINKLAIRQFTGLYDRNGKDIYEGDILETTTPYVCDDGSKDYCIEKGEVTFSPHEGWQVVGEKYVDFIHNQLSVVIGNIYEEETK